MTTALSAVAIGAGITVAPAVVAKAKTNATLEKIILVFMLAFSWLEAEPDPFSLRSSSTRQLSLKCAGLRRVFNKLHHAE